MTLDSHAPAVFAGVLCLIFGVAGLVQAAEEPLGDALADYLARPDETYQWIERRRTMAGGASLTELILTSQTWRGTVWKHQLAIIKPPNADPATKQGVLFIAGGRWKPEIEQPAAENEPLPRKTPLFVALAKQLRSPVAVLRQVPHQPLFDGKREDALIALTFENYLTTGDADWPLLLPMVKSAVRAMDAVQEYAEREWSLTLETFTVAGASKRGWTTWLTGAVDPRAVALVPIAIDVLNMAPQMQHQIEAWGSYSHQIHDYTDRNLPERLKSEAGKALRAIVDPYSYRDRLAQPKLIIVGTNDQYWPLDALDLYWDELPGDKHVLYVPNEGHGIKDVSRVSASMTALHRRVAAGKQLPKMRWSFTEGEGKLSVRIESDEPPTNVRVWIANSPTRDFRNALWTSFPTSAEADGYRYELANPEEEYAAMFGEAMYEEEDLPFFLSTNVKIIRKTAESASASGAGATGMSP